MAKVWGGRFEGGLDPSAKSLSYSLVFDQRLMPYDIKVNKAHAEGLHQAGYLSEGDYKSLSDCLDGLAKKAASDLTSLLGDDEDIHSCIERNVTEQLGDLGKKLHTGKSRNDQVMTDTRLFLKDEIQDIQNHIKTLLEVLWNWASEHKETLFPGFTHFQPAQPVLLAHHLLAYFEKFERDLKRLDQVVKSTDVCPLGSGALAGQNYGVDREKVAKALGFSSISQNSMDAVSDRDFLLEFLSTSSIMMTHLSRFCEELVLWSSPLIGFITIGDAFTTGSSLMPQKKNPDMAELIRGKSGRVLGHLTALHHILKALPLTYNRDLQEDKELMFDTVDTVKGSLMCFTNMIQDIEVHKEPINDALSKGYLVATEIADYLVKKGVAFREAHDVTGKIVLYAIKQNKMLTELSINEFKDFHPDIDETIKEALTLEQAVTEKEVLGGTSYIQVAAQLNNIGERYQWNRH